jgi:hypothetical protein
MLKKLSEEYFAAFCQKNINKIIDLISPDISFRDWEYEAFGIKNVIPIYNKFFESAGVIQLDLLNIVSEKSFVIAELSISIFDLPPLKVVDVLEYSDDSKIKSLRAYKG